MRPDLPAALKHGVDNLLEGRSRKDIAQLAARMSVSYRAGAGSRQTIADAGDVTAYLLARLPATYAAASCVFSEIAARAPAFAPRSLLDAGAGPGTASWAAVQAWPGLASVRLLDERRIFLDMAKRLAASSGHPALSHATPIERNLIPPGEFLPSDLVVASYLLAELPEMHVAATALALWTACSGMLIFVEPGTPAGYRRILATRTALLAQGAAIVAPCPHAEACPIAPPDWCHFVQRLPRSRDHMIAKSAELPFEDEKFCYLAVARRHISFTPAASRVLAPPAKGKPGIELKLCVDGAIRRETIFRRDKQAYARHRNARWGDAV